MALLIVVILLRHPCVVVVYCDRSSAIRAFKIDYTILSAHRHSDGKKEDRTTTARRRMNSSPGECCANAYNSMLKQYVSHDHPKAPHCMATMTMRVPQNDSSNKREEQKKKKQRILRMKRRRLKQHQKLLCICMPIKHALHRDICYRCSQSVCVCSVVVGRLVLPCIFDHCMYMKEKKEQIE